MKNGGVFEELDELLQRHEARRPGIARKYRTAGSARLRILKDRKMRYPHKGMKTEVPLTEKATRAESSGTSVLRSRKTKQSKKEGGEQKY
jgi:hypothetical protein